MFDFNTKILANTTLYAKFNINSYQVTYNLASGSWNGATPQSTYTINESTNALPVPMRSGYLFEGWTDSAGKFIDNFPASSDLKNLVLTANWIQGAEGLSFNGNTVTKYTGTATEIAIPATYRKKNITAISANAFAGCNNLTSITIPNGIIKIGELAFSNCSQLKSMDIPESVTAMGEAIFKGCNNLIKISIPFIGENMSCTLSSWGFYYLQFGWLFGREAYNGGIAIKQDMYQQGNYTICYFPATLREVRVMCGVIPVAAFNHCTMLTKIVLEDGVKEIGMGAFDNCSGLTNIKIPDSVTSIGYSTFNGCSSLTSITIPENVTIIEGNAFSGCSSLTINCRVNNKPSGWNFYWNSDNRPVVWGYKE